MQALQKILSTLFAAFFFAAAGLAVAAPDASATRSQVVNGTDSGTQQTPDSPPDCKKTPSDPRCKDR